MPKISQAITSFNAGELAPDVQGRIDVEKYGTGANRIENFIVHPEGGVHRRPGSRFVRAAIDSTKKSRVIPFVFSTEQAYILELSEFNIRVFANELQVAVASRSIATADVSTTTDEFTFEDHGYVDQQGPFHITSTGVLPTTTPAIALDTDLFMSMPATLTFTDSDVNTGADTITFSGGHGYSANQGPFQLSNTGGALPTATTEGANIDYFILVTSSTVIQLSQTPGGAAINFTILFGGTHTIAPTGNNIRDNFRVALTKGGTPVDITVQGTGPHVFTPNPVGTPTGLPLDITTPFTEAQLYDIHFAQSADILFFAHGDHEPLQLSRISNTQWAIDFVGIFDGPFLAENTDTTRTVTPSGTTGNIDLTGSDADFFPVSDIGKILRIVQGSVVGFVEITGSTGAGGSTATVKSDLASTVATSNFSFGYWFTDNWPRAVSFFEQRLSYSGEADTPQTLHGSQSGQFTSFTPTELDTTVVDTNAFNFQIGANQVNPIRWLAVANLLVAGTSNSIFTARGSFDGEPITPTNIQVQKVTSVGSIAVQPVNVSDEIVYVTANNQSLRGLRMLSGADTGAPTDITLLAKHIFGRTLTITTMAFQQDRQQVIWITRSDGVLAAVTYIPEQQVFAWHRHIVGGHFGSGDAKTFAVADVDVSADTITFSKPHGYVTGQGAFTLTTTTTLPAGLSTGTNYYVEAASTTAIKLRLTPKGDTVDITDQGTGTHTITESGDAVVESVAVIPAPDETHDQVWYSVKRTVNGSTVRHIEFFEDEWLDEIPINMRYIDSAPAAFSGSASNTFSGLDHLEGETVQVLAGGAAHPDRVVSSGSITLDAAYTDVVAGLGYVSELETLRLEFLEREGASMGKIGRIDHLILRLFDTMGGQVGPDAAHLDPLIFRIGDDLMDELSPIFTGDHRIGFPNQFQREKRILFRQDEPLPFNLLAINVIARTGQG